MSQAPQFRLVRFVPVEGAANRDGLVGYVAGRFGGLAIDGIMVRRNAKGGHHLSYPQRTDSRGKKHHIVRPVDDITRRSLEAQVLDALDLRKEAFDAEAPVPPSVASSSRHVRWSPFQPSG